MKTLSLSIFIGVLITVAYVIYMGEEKKSPPIIKYNADCNLKAFCADNQSHFKKTLNTLTFRLTHSDNLIQTESDNINQIIKIKAKEISDTSDFISLINSNGNLNFVELYFDKELPGLKAILSKQIPGEHYNYGKCELAEVKEKDTATIRSILNMPDVKATLPPDAVFCFGKEMAWYNSHKTAFTLYCFHSRAFNSDFKLDNELIKDAYPEMDDGKPAIAIRFTDLGAVRWANLTKSNINRCIGVMADNLIIFSPKVANEITSSSTLISGSLSPTQAYSMSKIIAKPLPCSVQIRSSKFTPIEPPFNWKKLGLPFLVFLIISSLSFFLIKTLKNTSKTG
jgi:hypothetical protein